METELYARHTMTLLADHHDGQWKECLGGNPYGENRERERQPARKGRKGREMALAQLMSGWSGS
jgi:hypothetical protein